MENVVYKNNPLAEVIMQFKFPTILSINSNDPTDFQELIREEYPLYNVVYENEQEIKLNNNEEDNGFIPSVVNRAINKNYEFISEDGKYKINLTSSFISIATVDYTSWEEFNKKFENPIKSFISVYKPTFFNRIGLRYIDAISKKQLGLENEPWSELIKSPWIGALKHFGDDATKHLSMSSEIVIDSEGTTMILKEGLGRIGDLEEILFLVDTDFICERKIEIGDYNVVSNRLHSHSHFFIDEIITDKLKVAMKPEV